MFSGCAKKHGHGMYVQEMHLIFRHRFRKLDCAKMMSFYFGWMKETCVLREREENEKDEEAAVPDSFGVVCDVWAWRERALGSFAGGCDAAGRNGAGE